jgi:hypothetical protein
MMVIKIISGGQTGVKRATLDWAKKHGIRRGGYCPPAQRAEYAPIRDEVQMTELPGDFYRDPIERNVIESDGTLMINTGTAFADVAAMTAEYCSRYQKPMLLLKNCQPDGSAQLVNFVEEHQIYVFNVTGSSPAGDTGIESYVHSVLNESLGIFLFPCDARLGAARHDGVGLEQLRGKE